MIRAARRWVAGAVLIAGALAAPAIVSAQWVEPPGQGWVSLTGFHQDTREAYDRTSMRGPFPGQGHTVATQSFLTVAAGLTTGLDAWAQFSFQRLEFEDLAGGTSSTGPGDVRVYVRFNPLLLRGVQLPIALRGGVKLPVGDFDVGSSVLPLGDGQRDWELMLEVGHSFYPAPAYVMGWIGYKWRDMRDDLVDFGNERFFYVAAGGTARVVDYKVAFDGWLGATPVFNGVVAEGAERELLRISPSLLIGAGPGQIEVGTRLPITGKNLPAGADLVLGYFVRFGGGARVS